MMLRSLDNGAIVAGVLPLLCMVIFCILLSINLKQIRGRAQPLTSVSAGGNQRLRRRDRNYLLRSYNVTTRNSLHLRGGYAKQ